MALQPLVTAGDEDIAMTETQLLRNVPQRLCSIDDHEPERSDLIQPIADCINWQPNAVVADRRNEQAVAPHPVVVKCELVHDGVSRTQATADVTTN